jgi:hypothetical protein
MKKIFVLGLAMLLMMVWMKPVNASVVVKFAKDFSGTINYSGGTNVKYSQLDNNGQSIGIELLTDLDLDHTSELGYGLFYSFPRFSDNSEGRFSLLSFYLTENVYLSSDKIAPYLSGQIGYDKWYGNEVFCNGLKLNGGYYYGVGFGVRFGKPRFEFSHIGAQGKRGDENLFYTKDIFELIYKF